jgi:aryl-alcohol dehydrogenase-like predicted oxidoreductase
LCLGAAHFGTDTDEKTSVAILDRFVEAGGTFIDTADNYNQWNGVGGESETVLGSWLAARGNRDQIVLATKGGARTTDPNDPEKFEGLAARTIRRAAEGSLRRLGTDRIDLYYAHYDDRRPPLEETIGALGKLASDGLIGLVGCSNYATWRLERARNIAAAQGVAGYCAIQQEYTYVWPRPIAGHTSIGTPELLDYVAENPDVTLLAYSPLLTGAYGHPERALPANRGYAHASAYARYQVLREVAGDLGATPNQVALAWLLRQHVIPIFGTSSLTQLDEALEALAVTLDDDTMRRLDEG